MDGAQPCVNGACIVGSQVLDCELGPPASEPGGRLRQRRVERVREPAAVLLVRGHLAPPGHVRLVQAVAAQQVVHALQHASGGTAGSPVRSYATPITTRMFATDELEPQAYWPAGGRVDRAERAARPARPRRRPRRRRPTPARVAVRAGRSAPSPGRGDRARRRSPQLNPSAVKTSAVCCGLARTYVLELVLTGGEEQLGGRPVELVAHVAVVVRPTAVGRRRPPGAYSVRVRERRVPGDARRRRAACRRTPGRTSANRRAPCAATAARLRVAAVDGGASERFCGSSAGRSGRPVQPSSWILWCTMPRVLARTARSSSCIHSSSQRASSSTSGTPLPRSGTSSVPSPSAPAAADGARERPLVRAEQLRHGDAAVDHVLAVVAGVVPAARHVERVVARPAVVVVARADAGHLGVALVGRDADVAGLAGVLRRRRSTPSIGDAGPRRGRSSRGRPGAAAGRGPRRCRTGGSSRRRRSSV